MTKGGGSLGSGLWGRTDVPAVPETMPGSLEARAQQTLSGGVSAAGGRFGIMPEAHAVRVGSVDIDVLTDRVDRWARERATTNPDGDLYFKGRPGLWRAFNDLYPLQDANRWNPIRKSVATQLANRGWERSSPHSQAWRIPQAEDETIHTTDQPSDGARQSDQGAAFAEGAAFEVTLTRYERNPAARLACIKHWGYSCVICGLDFESTYGDRGVEFIQVHHLVALSTLASTHSVDPIEDLRPVCPNCHAMIHRSTPPATIDEIQALLRAS